MGLAGGKCRAAPEDLRALEQVFACFSEQTDQLRRARARLKQPAEQIDLELEVANCELQRKVQELDEAYNFQAGILQRIPTAVVVTDPGGIIDTFNPAAEQMWDTPAERARGRHFRRVMAPTRPAAGHLARPLPPGGRAPGTARRPRDPHHLQHSLPGGGFRRPTHWRHPAR